MKKTISAVIVASLAAYVSSANAQSTVTLYGVIDVGIDFTNNSGGKQLWHMQDGTYDGMYGSRWGLKGAEDLGGGLSAIFKLENGFNVINGTLAQGGREFGRQAWVGLSDIKLGTITLGRQYDSVVDYFAPVTMVGTWGGVDWHAGDIDNTGNSFRVNNSIKYASPSIAGFTFGGLMGLTDSNVNGTSKVGLWSAGVGYSIGSLNLAAAYLFAKDPGTYLSEGDYQSNTTGAAIGAAGPFSYVGQPKNQQIIGAGGTYKLGDATFALDYSNVKFNQANGTTATVTFSTYEAWGQYKLTHATTVALGYEFTDGSVGYLSAKPKYHEINFIADYNLSKRTDLYVSAAYQIAAGASQPADIFDGVTGTASTSNHQIAARVGLLHKF
ncbi:porin [Paraburkholderia sp. BCC1885]|uniref:porin n=1 Tax=Paraburkholderia sp. BCC1885 TaxID=2562669 RepID=UPI001182909E|nr:porin [Paraburkholderia sp. BCC1885]